MHYNEKVENVMNLLQEDKGWKFSSIFFPAITSSETSVFIATHFQTVGQGGGRLCFLPVNHLFSLTDVCTNWLSEPEQDAHDQRLSLQKDDCTALFFSERPSDPC